MKIYQRLDFIKKIIKNIIIIFSILINRNKIKIINLFFLINDITEINN